MTRELIIWGIIVSVASAILYGTINSIWNWLRSVIMERKQIKYLSKLINKYISDISDVDDSSGVDENDTYQRYRKIHGRFQYDLKVFSLARLPHLSTCKRAQFKLAYDASAKAYFTNKEGYLSLCEEYKKLEWIRKRLK